MLHLYRILSVTGGLNRIEMNKKAKKAKKTR